MKAMGKEQFIELIEKGDYELANTFKQEYIDLLKYYYFVGGMPEVVVNFADHQDFNEAREIQQRILIAYEQDFSKHAPNEVIHVFGCYGTVFLPSSPKKTRSLSTV